MTKDQQYFFGDFEEEYLSYKDSASVILPVPFDESSTWQKGSDMGPRALLSASRNLEFYDIETNSEVYKKGIFTDIPVCAEQAEIMISKVSERVQQYIKDNKFVVGLGGEHTVSLGFINAFSKKIDNLSILHLDAHSDYRQEYESNKYSHACVMARVAEYSQNIVSVGVRSVDSSELEFIDKNKMFFAERIVHDSAWIPKVLASLNNDVYITIDLDVLDPSIMPSTGTPEPGGLGWYQILELLSAVFREKNVCGSDVVELLPGDNKSSDFLAAKLVYKILSYKFFY